MKIAEDFELQDESWPELTEFQDLEKRRRLLINSRKVFLVD